MKLVGLSRQIAQSMMSTAFYVSLLVLVTSYLFYSAWQILWPGSYALADSNWWPSPAEWAWMIGTTLAGLALARVLAGKLSRRILLPLNAVAEGIRRVAQGDLAARAESGERSPAEAAQLVDDFNFLAGRLQHITEEQVFWNAAIAHELRTPVTILRGRLQGLADGVFVADDALVGSLLTQVEGLARLIEDLRVVSLVESGHLDLQMADVELSSEIEAVTGLFADTLAASGHRLVLELEAGQAFCDPVRIRQALLALLENVRRHATPGEVRIRCQREGNWWQLQVEDDGPGIAAAQMPEVFKAFRSLNGPANGQGGARSGSGLGLAVVAAIAEAHQGRASCQPSTQGGCCFELRWPGACGAGVTDPYVTGAVVRGGA
jgi:two-component system sensor histidine kinase AdeS